MAEIHVERKKRRSIWPWIVVLVLVAIAAWAVYTYGDRLGLHLRAGSVSAAESASVAVAT